MVVLGLKVFAVLSLVVGLIALVVTVALWIATFDDNSEFKLALVTIAPYLVATLGIIGMFALIWNGDK